MWKGVWYDSWKSNSAPYTQAKRCKEKQQQQNTRKNPGWWPEQSGKKKAVNYAATEAGEQQIQKGLCE